MSDWNLRRAVNADRAAVMILVADGLAEFGLHPDPSTSEADLLDLEAAYDGSGGLFLVADHEGLIGCGGLLMLDAETAKIRKMYVRSDRRGEGIGRTILRRLIDEAKWRGKRRVVLETTGAMRAAQALYEAHGFRPVAGEADSPRCDRVYVLELG